MKFCCRICNSSNLTLIIDLGKQPWGNDFIKIKDNIKSKKFPLRLVFCNNCSLVQLDYTIPKEKMFINHSYMSGTTRTLNNHFVSVSEKICKKFNVNKKKFVVDIGGNDGTFLDFYKNKKIEVLNVESGKAQAKISKKKGIHTINSFFNNKIAEKIIKKNGLADIIHGSGIFFHLEELHSVFKGIKKLLNPNKGVLVAQFIYLPKMIKSLAYDQIYHEHLLYYTLNTFQNLLNQHDLEIFDFYFSPIHGGSCIAYISHSGNFDKSQKLKKELKVEKTNGYLNINKYLLFSNKIKKLKIKLLNKINYLIDKKYIIHGLGAPVKGSTMINYLGLNSKHLTCAVEINPHKFNTFYPGTDIPVYDQFKMKAPDIYLLLAWNFKDEILKKMKSFRDKKGKVLIPIPKVEIL